MAQAAGEREVKARSAIDMVKEAADMRFTYTKTLYEYYVKPDLGEWVEEPVAALA